MIKGSLNLKMYESLIQKGLVRAKEENGLVILKHSREVFWKDLWDQSPLLLEARGHAFDADTGECIVRPFHKIFNWNEKDCGLKPWDSVYASPKVNGFMGAVTWHPKFGIIYSTTGSVTSPFANMVRKHFEAAITDCPEEGVTHLFEIVDESDPHIIQEEVGIHYLSSRKVYGGDYTFHVFKEMPCPVGDCFDFRGAVERGLNAEHEGFVIYKGYTPITKVKSKKYLFMKALARAKEGRLAKIFANEDKGIADDMKPHIETLRGLYSESKWAIMPEQERLNILREIIYTEG